MRATVASSSDICDALPSSDGPVRGSDGGRKKARRKLHPLPILDNLEALMGLGYGGRERPGLLALDVYGGFEALKSQRERRRQRGFTYVWDQFDFDPLSHHVVNHIDFEFPDGSRKPRAFSYHWRLWLIPELRELLTEAGFSDVGVYWEGTDLARNTPNGVFTRRRRGPPDPAWIAYVIALC